MSEGAKAVLEAALALPAAEQREVLEQFVERLSSDDVIEAELARRLAEFRRDPSVAQTWDELRRLGRAP